MTRQIILFINLLFVLGAFSQAPTIEWQKTLGGTDVDKSRDIRQTSDGGYIVTGHSRSTNGDVSNVSKGGIDVWLVKLDANGTISWQASLGGSNNDYGQSTLETFDHSFIMVGYTFSTDGDFTGSHGMGDVIVVKYDINGNLVWKKTLGGSNDDGVNSIQQTSDGGYILSGFSASNNGDATKNNGARDFWIIKLDALGNIVWQKSYGGSNSDNAFSAKQTNDGGYIVAGHTLSINGDVVGNHGDYDYWVLKLDASGNITWKKCLGGSGTEFGYSIDIALDGGYIVCGSSTSNGSGDVTSNHGGYDCWIVKLSTTGSIQWQKSLGGSGDDASHTINRTIEGGYVVSSYSNSNNGDVSGNHGDFDIWLFKLSVTGALEWQKSLGGSLSENSGFLTSYSQTKDCGFIIAVGSTSNDGDASGNHGNFDFWIVKMSSICTPPAAPTGNTTQSFCMSGKIADLTVNGSEIKWYSSASGGIPIDVNTPLSNDSTYYASQTICCESLSRLAVTANINTTAAPTGINNQNYCIGATVNNLTATGSNIIWYDTISGGVPLSASSILENGKTYYATQTINNCESITRFAVSIILNDITNTVTQISGQLMADQAGASYAWLDCNNANQPIAGATSQSFTPSESGSYAVRVSLNGCVDTSSCINMTVTGIRDKSIAKSFTIYPNPSHDFMHISSIEQITALSILDIAGKEIYYYDDNTSKVDLSQLTQGIYLLKINFRDGTSAMEKIIKR